VDAVGTLIFAEPAVSVAYSEIGRRYGSRQSAEQVKGRLAEAMRRAGDFSFSVARFGEADRTDEAHEREFWRRVVGDVLPDLREPEACFAELFEHFARPESWRCFADVEPTLRELQRRGYRVVIASNFDARLNRVCDGLPSLRDVRCRVISSLVGYRKTHPGFYTAVAEAAECEPSEVLMVGDDLVNDVESAQAAGIAAVHLRRDGQPSLSESQVDDSASGPKGRHSKAQGDATNGSDALGRNDQWLKSPERAKPLNVAPSGLCDSSLENPGRRGSAQADPLCPGLSSCGPSGQSAKNHRSPNHDISQARPLITNIASGDPRACALRFNDVTSLTDLLECLP
jgi:putative hydrolase of the HAD superfamily